MNYRNWYGLTINTNKERSCREQLLARKAKFQDTYIQNVEYLQKKELVISKDGKRKITNKLLMPGYLLVQVTPMVVENEDGTTSKVFPPDSYDIILGTPDIKSFVNANKKKPLAFRPSEIKKMFEMCDDAHLEVKQNIVHDYEVGDILEVVSGPFAGYTCEVANIQGNKILGQLDMFDVCTCRITKNQVIKK